MKLATLSAAVLITLSSGVCLADPLTDKSKAPDWGKASQAEKDAWIAAYQFKNADADKAGVVKCLDDYAGKPLFETNALSGVTGMCETIAALPE
jgi:hypothetical protein